MRRSIKGDVCNTIGTTGDGNHPKNWAHCHCPTIIMADNAQQYDKLHFAHQAKDGVNLIDQLSPAKGNRVLDIGCGTGFLASVLAKRVGPEGMVTGVDPDTERIHVAQKNYSAVNNLEFVEGNVDNFPAGSYDIVFSNYVFHWIEDKESAFRKVFQSMKAGGQFGLVCPERNISKSVVPIKAFFSNSEVYENIARKCGFTVAYRSVEPHAFSFTSVDSCLEWYSATCNIDHKSVNPASIKTFKEEAGNGPYDFKFIKIQCIFKKPEY